MKHDWLIHEARKWVGTMESGGDNRGPIVDHFITQTGGTLGSAWCLSFARFCCDRVDTDSDLIYALSESERNHNILFETQSVMELWIKTPTWARWSLKPIPGFVTVWEHFSDAGTATGLGHCGIVSEVVDSGRWFKNIEGNTGPERGGDINRQGDGVYEKTRSVQGSPRFRILGWVDPWAVNS
jgi:hypothetical protein